MFYKLCGLTGYTYDTKHVLCAHGEKQNYHKYLLLQM
jgi:hypothetical protein